MLGTLRLLATLPMMTLSSEDHAPYANPVIHHNGSQGVTLPPGTALAIGNFDGVHLGHQAVIARARLMAERLPGEHQVAVLTFDPHPAKLLAPELAPALLSTPTRRAELLGKSGASQVILEPFDEALASLTARDFVEEILVGRLRAAGVVVGYDFTFGRDRTGNVEMLRDEGEERGFQVAVVPPFFQDGMLVSSTKIREFILAGRVMGASILLGRPFELSGKVMRGAGRGRTIGFPTANLAYEQEILPAFGVYAARARLGVQSFGAAVSIGIVPTFKQDREVTVEAYLLDFSSDLYAEPLTLELVKRIRPERRFETVASLVQQIGLDVEQVRDILLTL